MFSDMKTTTNAPLTMSGLWFLLDGIKALSAARRWNAVNALKGRIAAERFAHPHLARWFEQADAA